MKRNEHMREYKRLWDLAMLHLQAFNASAGEHKTDWDEYKQYREIMKQANRHHGTASMMLTKEIKKLA